MNVEPRSPLLILVNGRPATGKSALAARISHELDIALFTKDAVKELLGDLVGAPDRAAARTLGEASIALIFQHAETVLVTGAPAMIECPLLPDLTVPVLDGVQERTGCRLLQLFLTADTDVILDRYRNRDRNDVHFDADALRELEQSLHETEVPPVPIDGETWTLDTTDFEALDIAALVERVQGQIASD